MIFLALASLWASTAANDSPTLEFYLPVNSTDMNGLDAELNAALQAHGLTTVAIKFADHWHDFQQGLRNGRPGIYLAPPHFSAWAANKHNFMPILRIAEPLSFVIATKRIQAEFFELNDLVGHRICVQKPLNLDYLLTTQVFDTRVGTINTEFVTNVSSTMRATQTDCDGFAVSNHILQRLIAEGDDDYIRLHQGQTYNNYAFVAHPDIDAELLARLRQFFIKSGTQQILQPLLSLYANDATLISSRQDDYPATYMGVLENYWQNESP